MDDHMNGELRERAKRISLLLTDIDGVWTDTGVYYSEQGEVMKRFSLRDGMGVERLRELAGVETGIVTGENSAAVIKRAEKLGITEVHILVQDKAASVKEIMERRRITPEKIAFIGDDMNDIEAMKTVGLCACPSDAVTQVRKIAHFVATNKGGFGAFRDFAEMIISYKNEEVP
ncbi:MAG: HAD-IA family hydrolase [Thermodesulfovibrionales bacterium]|jgi:3-deoxy-D-manno-octulosonate 8-phosphate phosphatase (KDO 8-P phosphatase)